MSPSAHVLDDLVTARLTAYGTNPTTQNYVLNLLQGMENDDGVVWPAQEVRLHGRAIVALRELLATLP